MVNIIEITKEQQQTYDKLATHPLQSWEWGEFRKAEGHKVFRIGIFEEKKLIQVFQLTLHKIPHTTFTIGYLPKSAFPTKEVIEKLKQIGKENKTIFIKIEPNVENSQSAICNLQFDNLIEGEPLFTKFTSIIDLTKTEDEIFNGFKNKTRYNIRLAENHSVKIKEDNSDEAFEKYLDLLFETTQRQGFYAHSKTYHRNQWKIMKAAGISHLMTAAYNNQILSAFLLFVFNNVLYYPYGASTREHKELMSPTLLMWEAIKFGKKHGCDSFDLWGDTELNPPPDHPYFGFHRFKEGFSPKLVEFIGTYDLVISPTLYRVYQLIDLIRWKILHLIH